MLLVFLLSVLLRIEPVMEEHEVPRMAIAVVTPEKTELHEFGEKGTFPIASCTKAFTAHLAAELVEEGQLDWDQPIIEVWPGFALSDDRTKEVNLRDLLTHRTGLPRHDLAWLHREIPRRELMEQLRHLPPEAPLREQFIYNNLMYMAAGELMEEVTGQTWEELVQTRIFDRLGMKESRTGDPLPGPAGSIESTAGDMARWISYQLTLPHPDVGEGEYGLGWFISNHEGHQMLAHAGFLEGAASKVVLLPELGIGVAVMASGGDHRVAPAVAMMLIDELLGAEQTDRLPHFEGDGLYTHPAYGTLEINGLTAIFNGESYPMRQLFTNVYEIQFPWCGTRRCSVEPEGLLVLLEEKIDPILFERK